MQCMQCMLHACVSRVNDNLGSVSGGRGLLMMGRGKGDPC